MTQIVKESVGWSDLLNGEYASKVAMLVLAVWLHASNSMLTATTMPSATAEIGGINLLHWTFSLYLAASIVAGASISLLVPRYGMRNSMQRAVILYIAGCAICALAPSMPVVLVGRVLQGLGGGGLVTLVYIAQKRYFPNHFIPRIIACLSVTWMVAAFCGPMIGGALKHDPLPFVRLALLASAIVFISSAGTDYHALYSPLLALIGVAALLLFVLRDRRATLGRMLPHGPLWLLVAVVTIANLGFGMMWGFIIKRLIALAPEAEKDRASSLPPITLQTGFALGSALSGIIANGLGLGTDINDQTMQRIAFWIFAGFIPLALIGNIFAWRFVRRV